MRVPEEKLAKTKQDIAPVIFPTWLLLGLDPKEDHLYKLEGFLGIKILAVRSAKSEPNF